MNKLDLIKKNLSIIPKTSLVEVIDESNNHSHSNNSHFRVLVVSDYFTNMKTVQRHRTIYEYVQNIQYHALGITALSNIEYNTGKLKNTSPECVKNT